MKTNPSLAPAISTTIQPSALATKTSSPSDGGSPSKGGRPSGFSTESVAALCEIIRATGISESGAAGRANVHPSTVSRWKRDFPELAILLRSAREEFRAEQLDLILTTARAGHNGSWRAAAWLLERTFPQDYSPRAKERAHFQEMEEAACAREAEAWEPRPEPAPGAEPTSAKASQSVQNSPASAPASGGETPASPEMHNAGGTHPRKPLQNVQNPPASAPAGNGATSSSLEMHNAGDAHLSKPLQNVQNPILTGSILPTASRRG